ncbi:SGNH/GDSL hydrolase family protein [Clostridium luticellarii]|jgi:lysophospholipase L1-like esterase|uniref:GDSL-like Lipase/Acylhydrolase n=1 Tax=Clostridium luticellarii TaxID=1691940 RepID=A0A2T0BGU3_9CLOT|nr:SGNH/GDSL hydrolase family protein [Clostridium luticellarii]MCI1943953.1 SGNH/GDSL hydrolase family protein [Clostridium luticellarii]MCI1967214.1 SGNH/GDSL hydrolase family protein [Clostridium luticellarii]MCI1995945.1 SGNH/GDSL hydrolase family protein [Clostridium luticellarii]MCI2038466.1 SGNH/GDSL hydrolase family protein [Clostridium luticellarii]PRR83085.1 GDSL-like Lipase/Acylhydrolase [Clostridium luticellarii]
METKKNYSLVAFGDSITEGVVYDSSRGRYSNLKNCFANLVGRHIKGTVCNSGRFGSTIKRGIKKMYNDVIKKTPDIVLIEFGGNDCDFNWEDIAKDPDSNHKPKTDISTFHDILSNMICTFEKSGITPILMTLPPLDYKRYFNWITRGDKTAEKNVLKWLGSEEKIYNWHRTYSEMVTEVAHRTKTALIDVRSEILKQDDYNRFLCIDGIHPNLYGHSLIANVILNFLKDNYSFLLI